VGGGRPRRTPHDASTQACEMSVDGRRWVATLYYAGRGVGTEHVPIQAPACDAAAQQLSVHATASRPLVGGAAWLHGSMAACSMQRSSSCPPGARKTDPTTPNRLPRGPVLGRRMCDNSIASCTAALGLIIDVTPCPRPRPRPRLRPAVATIRW